jgi:hypothetical protein
MCECEISNWIITECEKKMYTWYLFCTMNELFWHSNHLFIQAHTETIEIKKLFRNMYLSLTLTLRWWPAIRDQHWYPRYVTVWGHDEGVRPWSQWKNSHLWARRRCHHSDQAILLHHFLIPHGSVITAGSKVNDRYMFWKKDFFYLSMFLAYFA